MLQLLLKAAIKPMCVTVNVLLVISESDPSPEMMVLGGNKILELHKHSGGSLLSPKLDPCVVHSV